MNTHSNEESANLSDELPCASTVDISKKLYTQSVQTRLKLSSTLQCATQANDPHITEQLHILEKINSMAGSHIFYESDQHMRVHPDSRLPFRLSTDPFILPDTIRNSLNSYGQAIARYYHTCDELLSSLPNDHRWSCYLNHHKPQYLIDLSRQQAGSHLFLRPDFILTNNDPVVTEIETSPFGLALSHFLNFSFEHTGKFTAAHSSRITDELVRGMTGECYNDEHLFFALTN